jgi:hypothetical protein
LLRALLMTVSVREKVAYPSSFLLAPLQVLMMPLVWLLNTITRILMRIRQDFGKYQYHKGEYAGGDRDAGIAVQAHADDGAPSRSPPAYSPLWYWYLPKSCRKPSPPSTRKKLPR